MKVIRRRIRMLTSMLLVLFVLPSILILGDKFIEATRFGNRKTKAHKSIQKMP